MLAAQGVRRMEKKELNDLLRLKGWSRTQLAGALDMTEAAIHSWFRGDRDPRGPAVILMRLWLREARGEIRIVEVEKLEPVPA